MGKCGPSKLDLPLVEEDSIGGFTFHQFSIALAASFTIAAGVLSFYLIFRHITNYNRPLEQKQNVRIIFMVPVYGLTSCLAIKYYEHHVYLEAVHQLYEALVLASFFVLLCRYMAPTTQELEERFKEIEPRSWIPPIKWLNMCTGGKGRGPFRTPRSGVTYIHVITIGVFQYSVVKLCTTLITFITEATDTYCAESKSTSHAAIWVKAIQIISLIIAMIFLMQFYLQFKESLRHHNPFLKFLAIKFVVFLSYVQTFILNQLTTGDSPTMKPSSKISYQSLDIGIPNMVLCIEMAIAAIIHLWAYPWRGYRDAGIENPMQVLSESATELTDREGGSADEIDSSPKSFVAKPTSFGSALRIFADAMNFWDIMKEVAYSIHWLFVEKKRQPHPF
ncbi:Protein LAZ1-like protein 1 [Lasiodiplodia hormozganensis]|uniref:Protein LAZ1-like protein 1 n=1 Tax=Lasiodiplodia hormozganensis TaxID=869390 RepID=A0AA39Y5G8_9PEZI|nr:Protein LAZ1-like protein 1 [Lasiodiplodia hormozganensis]